MASLAQARYCGSGRVRFSAERIADRGERAAVSLAQKIDKPGFLGQRRTLRVGRRRDRGLIYRLRCNFWFTCYGPSPDRAPHQSGAPTRQSPDVRAGGRQNKKTASALTDYRLYGEESPAVIARNASQRPSSCLTGMRLDFSATQSVSEPEMARRIVSSMQDKDETGTLFSVLAGLLEDASGLAAEGQNPGLTSGESCAIVTELRSLLNQSTVALDELYATLRAG